MKWYGDQTLQDARDEEKRRGMKDKKEIRISQCMIVKDEEENIERALSWGKSVVWEQIVVDTGSADRTVELAKAMGAKVYEIEWPDDFAAAKNYAIERAKGDWIVFLDADEYMSQEDAEKLPQVFAELSWKGFDGAAVMLYNLDETGRIFSSCSHLRLFRNAPDIRYRRRIHEQLVSFGGRELRILDGTGELSIFHTGYQGKVSAEKKKSGRNRRMLQREIEDHPEDPELLGYMGDEYFDDGEREEALRWYRLAAQYMSAKWKGYDQRSAVTFTRLLMALTEREIVDWTETEAVYGQAAQAFPKEADLDYVMGRAFVSHGRAEEALSCLEKALGKLEAYGGAGRALFLGGNLEDAYNLLTKSCYETGERQKCVAYAVQYLKYDRYGMGLLIWLLKALLQNGDPSPDKGAEEAVLGFLARLYDLSSLKDRLFVIKAAEKAGCDDLVSIAKDQFFTADEQRILGLR